MKLVLFAHTPPPQHGQSVMVQLMLEGLGGNHGRNATPPGIEAASPTPSARAFGIECFHVNARLSDDLEDVGQPRWGKIILLLKYCIKAIALRLRHGISTLYYVPSPPKRASLYRDWVVMLLCRPFFRRIVFHWHAVGLGEWLQRHARPWERHLTHALLGRANLAIVLSRFNESDSARLHPRHTRVVSNGIPDPCPDYGTRIAPLRAARARERLRHLDGKGHSQADQAMTSEPTPLVNVLYMAHCTRDKGLFDAVEGVRHLGEHHRHPEHSLSRRRQITSRELGEQVVIAHSDPSPVRDQVIRRYEERHESLNIELSLPSLDAIKRAVEMRLGVALLPRRCALAELASGRLVAVPVRQLRLRRQVRLVYRAGAGMSRAAAAFLAVARQMRQVQIKGEGSPAV